MIASLIASAVAGFATPATAAPTWHAPLDLATTGTNPGGGQVFIDQTGTATVIWNNQGVMQAATRPAGGSFSAPVDLPIGQVPVAFNAAGDAVAVWTDSQGVVQVAVRPAGGSFSAAVPISAPGANQPRATIDANRGIVATWRALIGGRSVIQSALRPPDGSFSAPVNLSPPDMDAEEGYQIAANSRGDTVVVWTSDDASGNNRTTDAAIRPAGGAFGPSVVLSAPSSNSGQPQAAIDPAGNVIVAWDQSGPLQVSERPFGGAFSPPTNISEAGNNSFGPSIAVDPLGNAIVVWEGQVGVSPSLYPIVKASTRPVGGTFSAPVDVSARSIDFVGPGVAIGANGDAVVTWSLNSGATPQASVRPAGGSFSAPVDLSPSGVGTSFPPVAAVDARGNIVAVWDFYNGTAYTVRAATYDTLMPGTVPPAPTPPGPAPPAPAPPQPAPPADTTPPVVKLTGSTVQKLGSTVALVVACPSEPCHASVSGTIRIPIVGHAAPSGVVRSYKLKAVTASIGKGGHTTLRLRLASSLQGAIRRDLRAGRKMISVGLTVRAVDAAGNATTVHRQVRLRN